jgi:DNA-binding transcriptional LysR family regulator
MNIDDVRAFVAVVDSGSVGRAALKLNLTQPAVTRRVQRLEESLGVTLLDRESKPARPTRAGEGAYARCMAVLRAADTLTRETRPDLMNGALRIGVSLGIAECVFTPALDVIRARFPDIALHLLSAYSGDLRKRMSERTLDAGIVMSRTERPLDDPGAERLGIERVAIIAGRNLALPPHRKLADLGGIPWVINPDGCGFRVQLDRALAASGHSLDVAAEAWGTGLQMALVARGAGLGLVPERFLIEFPQRDALRVIALEDFDAALAVWLIRAPDLSAYAAPVDLLAETVRGLLSQQSSPSLAQVEELTSGAPKRKML